MRSTLAYDSPYYRGRVAPFNVKHGLVDPSHTMMHTSEHHTRRNMDFMGYNKKTGEPDSRYLQHVRRETPHFTGSTLIRLPEARDVDRDYEKNPLD